MRRSLLRHFQKEISMPLSQDLGEVGLGKPLFRVLPYRLKKTVSRLSRWALLNHYEGFFYQSAKNIQHFRIVQCVPGANGLRGPKCPPAGEDGETDEQQAFW